MGVPISQHERLQQMREWLGIVLQRKQGAYGLGAIVGLLIDHWVQVTPDLDWVKRQIELYPMRGKIRKGPNEKLVDVPFTKWRKTAEDPFRGHRMAFVKDDPDRKRIPKMPPWALRCVCIRCGYMHLPGDGIRSMSDGYVVKYTCPMVDHTSEMPFSKIWVRTKEELRASGLDVDDVDFGDGEPEQDRDPDR